MLTFCCDKAVQTTEVEPALHEVVSLTELRDQLDATSGGVPDWTSRLAAAREITARLMRQESVVESR